MYHGHNTRWLTGGGRTLRNYLQSQLVLWQGLCILMSTNSHRDDYCQSQLLWQCLCLLIDIGMVIHHSPITIHHASGGSFTFSQNHVGCEGVVFSKSCFRVWNCFFSQNRVVGCEAVLSQNRVVVQYVKLSFSQNRVVEWSCLFLKIQVSSEAVFFSKSGWWVKKCIFLKNVYII